VCTRPPPLLTHLLLSTCVGGMSWHVEAGTAGWWGSSQGTTGAQMPLQCAMCVCV
jgi:hypothetical protein